MGLALLALAALLPCAGANDMVDALAAPLRVAPAAGEEALVRRHAIEPLDPSLDDEARATLRAERAELMKTNMYHGTTTVAFRFDGGTMCCVDSLARELAEATPRRRRSRRGRRSAPWRARPATAPTGLASATSKLAELETAFRRVRAQREYRGVAVAPGQKPDLSVGTMMFDDATLTYADNSGACLAGHLFAVGSGSPYAQALDAGYRPTKRRGPRTSRRRPCAGRGAHAYSGGIVNVYFADKATGARRLRRLR
ncbi:threonine-type endopeptidase [Aureococcus anophagefferens]|nr:threonine-type endopeptidase [Aureococcus anophagefferens]